MKRILLIGIGAGGIELLTVQAIEALRRVDVFFMFDKGEEKSDLVHLRREICARYCTDKPYRVVEVESPPREANGSYKSGVASWHAARAERTRAAIDEALADGQVGGFLVWGDPAFYDSTLRIIEMIKERAVDAFEYEVVPGIGSVQLLAARHRIALNAIGEPVLITTGRKLAENFPTGYGSVVVFLDNGDGLRSLAGRKAFIYWGAYLGTTHEILVSGPVEEVLDGILELRARKRSERGWIMDIYLLCQPPSC